MIYTIAGKNMNKFGYKEPYLFILITVITVECKGSNDIPIYTKSQGKTLFSSFV